MEAQINLAPKTLALFTSLAKDACNWHGTPLFNGGKSEAGCLMNLKKYGLVRSFDDNGCTFVEFLDEGKGLAASLGIDLETGKVDPIVKDDVNVGVTYLPPAIADGLHKTEVENAKWAMRKSGNKVVSPESASSPKQEQSKSHKRVSKFSGKTIRLLASSNPRRKGTHGYLSMEIVIKAKEISYEEYIKAGGRPQDLQWDLDRKSVEVVSNAGGGSFSSRMETEMIELNFYFIEGGSKQYKFKTLEGARKKAQYQVGKSPNLGRGYAIDEYGCCKVSVVGCTLRDLFPDAI